MCEAMGRCLVWKAFFLAIMILGNGRVMGESAAPLAERSNKPTSDPMPQCELSWSTYIGGNTGMDHATSVATDGSGNVYVTGISWSTGWVSGGLDTTQNGQGDIFVIKLTPAGQHVWSTYMGDGGLDAGTSIAVDHDNNVCITGLTNGFAVTGGYDITFNGGYDGFVAKLTPAGKLIWSTFLGGGNDDYPNGIAVDRANNIAVCGETLSSGWVSGGLDVSYNGGHDAFVVKISPSGAHLWSTYLGGSSDDYGRCITVDNSDNILCGGDTASAGWTVGGYDLINNSVDGFVVKLTPGGQLAWSSYVGGSGSDSGYGIAVDPLNNVLLAGKTDTVSPGWITGGYNTNYGGATDAFLAKLSPNGAFLWSTYLGGAGEEWGYCVVADSVGDILVAGETISDGWISGGFDTTREYAYDAFVVKLAPEGTHLWSTYLGGLSNDTAKGIAMFGARNIFVAGLTRSSGWVTGGYDTSFGGYTNGFLAKIHDLTTPDIVAPQSAVSPLPEVTTTATLTIAYIASDIDSSIKNVQLYYRRAGGAWTAYGSPVLTNPIPFDTKLTGGDGVYDFYTVATDSANNVELSPAAADAHTQVITSFSGSKIYVRQAAPAGGNGKSWATALNKIGKALIVATKFGVNDIRVAAGTYYETISVTTQTALSGGYAGIGAQPDQRDVIKYASVIDASRAAPTTVAVALLQPSTFDGFSVTGSSGGGIYCGNSTITHCRIFSNQSNSGAGIYCASSSNASISDCIICGNDANNINIPSGHYSDTGYAGGGIYCGYYSQVRINNCIISGNSATQYGGGVHNSGASTTMTNCLVTGNSANTAGGIYYDRFLYTDSQYQGSVLNCTINSNTANSGGGLSYAPDFPSLFPDWIISHLKIVNCIFENNTNCGINVVNKGSFTKGNESIISCLFRNNPICVYDAGEYNTAAQVNARFAGSNLDGPPDFAQEGSNKISGSWSQPPAYDAQTRQTTLTATINNLSSGSLKCRLLNPNTNQRRQFMVLDNTASTIVVAGDATAIAHQNNSWLIADYHLGAASVALDTGTPTWAPKENGP